MIENRNASICKRDVDRQQICNQSHFLPLGGTTQTVCDKRRRCMAIKSDSRNQFSVSEIVTFYIPFLKELETLGNILRSFTRRNEQLHPFSVTNLLDFVLKQTFRFVNVQPNIAGISYCRLHVVPCFPNLPCIT